MNSLPPKIEKATELINEGVREYFEANYLEAISKFDQALKLHPASLHAFQYRALCKHMMAVRSDDVPLKEQQRYMREVISDLENATREAKNRLRFLAMTQHKK